MALAGGRRIEYASGDYEWVVRRRGNEFRLVAQDVAARGQFLVARFPVYDLYELNESHGDYYMRTRIPPWRLRSELAQAFRHGWRPTEKGLPPLLLGSAGGCGLEDARFCQHIDDLWTVLDAICRDPDWRVWLGLKSTQFVPPPADVRGLDAGVAARLAEAGGWAVHVRPRSYDGDNTPHLAIGSRSLPYALILEDISEWYRG